MSINKNEITKEMLEKAVQCNTAEELIALAKSQGVEITKEEADAYLDEMSEWDLDAVDLEQIAGGKAPGGGDKSIPPESRY
ncbi:MAG: DUF2624 family protein [Lachnospiraceae bacterium]|nr:DUF2624 family protein [Lachnospiraceae bacterium]